MSHSTPRRWLVAAPLVLVSALALSACDRNKPGEPPNSTPAPTTAPEPATPSPTTPAPGNTGTSSGSGMGAGSATGTGDAPSGSTVPPAADPASTPSTGASSPG